MIYVVLNNSVSHLIERKLSANFCDMTMPYKQWHSNFLLTVEWIRELQQVLKYLPNDVDSFKNIGDCWKYETELGELYLAPINSEADSTLLIRIVDIKFINQGRFSTLFEYNQKLHTTMNNTKKKKVMRLMESALHKVIKQCVNEALNELDWKTYANAAAKSDERQRKFDWKASAEKKSREQDRKRKFDNAAMRKFNDDFGWRNFYGEIGHPDMRVDLVNAGVDGDLPVEVNGTSVYPYKKSSQYVHSDGIRKPKTTIKNPNHFSWNEEVPDDNYLEKGSTVRKAFDKAEKEVGDYNKGNYEYQKGKGWQLKDKGLDESIRRSIRKVISNL